MSEETKKVTAFDGAMGVAKIAGTTFAGLILLGNMGIGGTLALAGFAAAGTGAYAYSQDREAPFEKFKSLLSKVGDFYKKAWSDAKAGFGIAKEWADEKEAARTAAPAEAPDMKAST